MSGDKMLAILLLKSFLWKFDTMMPYMAQCQSYGNIRSIKGKYAQIRVISINTAKYR